MTLASRLLLIAVLCRLAVPTGGIAAQESRRTTLELRSAVFGNTRSIRVLLPPGYDDPAKPTRRYPVFYFLDGIAAWDAWGVPEVADSLWRGREIGDWIFVGIDNGGSTKESTDPVRDRASEYLPYADPTWTESTPPEPRARLLPAFLFDEVKPLVDSTFRTLSDARHTGLAGDSYAGAAALFVALERPDRLGYLLLESPSLHVGDGRLIADARDAAKLPMAVYLGVGTAEGDTPAIRERMVTTVRELYDVFAADPDRRVRLVVRRGATHWYDAWRDRLPQALRFLLTDGGS